MQKVLQINVTANWGSTGKIAESIGIAAKKHGWESYIAYGRWSKPSKSHLIKVGNKLDMYLHYGEQRIRDNEGLCSRIATKRLIRQIKAIKPNIVHLHNIHDHYLNYLLLFEYLNQTQIEVVWTFHDFWAVTGHCMHFSSSGCTRFISGCHDCPMQKVYPKTLIDCSHKNWELKKSLFSANKNLTIVPVSEWVGEQVRMSFLKEKRMQVILNGIDTSVFKPTTLSELGNLSSQLKVFQKRVEGKFVIMSVASEWKNGKGLSDFVSMSKILKDDETIVLVGIPDEMINALPSNVIGITRTSNANELAALYTRANVVCSLSSAETFGLTIVEGFACGTPAVVYGNTALPYLITPETGFVARNLDVADSYEKIQTIKHRGDSYYSEACIKVARAKFNQDVCVEEYFKLYNCICPTNC